MNKDCFVRVEVPTVDGGGQNCQEPGGITGTGYPVGNNLILTARHVVRPEKQRDQHHAIRIRWHSFAEWGVNSDGVIELDKDDKKTIVWESDKETDIALIHCPHAPMPIRSARFLNRLPIDDDRFKSIGFPRATRFGQSSSQNSFSGKIRVPNEPWFEICDTHAPRDTNNWMGASGMPIFVEGRITGVFSEVLTEIVGKGFAIPVQPLLESDPKFRELVGYDYQLETEWQEYRNQVAVEVKTDLEKSQKARIKLLQMVDCPAANRSGISDKEACQLLSEALLEMAFIDFSELANDLYRKLSAPGGTQEDETAAQTIFRITHQLAPALYDPNIVRIACEQRDSASLIELPAAQFSVAELAVAAASARAAEFRPRRHKMDLDPLGKRVLPAVVPELGIGVSSTAASDKIEEHLNRKQMRFDQKTFLKDLGSYLDETFYPPERPFRNEDDDLRDGINSVLALYGDRSPFYLVFRPSNEDEFTSMEETAKILKDRYPHLTILFLVEYRFSNGERLWDRDAREMYKFCQMLPVKGSTNP